MAKKAAAILLITAVFLVLLESIFRIYDYGFRYRKLQKLLAGRKTDIPVPFEEIMVYLFKTGKCIRDHKLIWRYAPGKNSPELNSLGIRTQGGKELVHFKGSDVYRIIVFGGSHPYGLCLPYENSYACQLEKIFAAQENKSKERIEVINAAVPGYSTAQVLNFLKYYMVDYDPDLVIIDAGINDGILLTPEYQLSDAEALRMSHFICKTLNILDRSSFVWYYRAFLNRTIGRKKEKINKNIDAPRPRVSKEENLCNLNEMKEIAAKGNFKILFLSQMRLDGEGNLQRVLGARVEPYLDIYAQLKQKKDIRRYFIDDIHGSKDGHRLIAEIIYDYLNSNDLFLQ